MSEPTLILKPNVFHALFPLYVKRLVAYVLASISVYYFLIVVFDFLVMPKETLIPVLIIITLLMPFILIKHKLIMLHATRYEVYETHFARHTKIFRSKRNSMPHAQVSKIKVHMNIWDRLTNTSDIHLKSGDGEILTLTSVRDPHEVEHKLYKMLARKERQ